MLDLSLAVLILMIISAAIPGFGSLRNDVTNKINGRGYLFFFVSLILIIVTACQILLVDIETQRTQEKEIVNQDSLRIRIQRGIDSGMRSNNLILAEAFKIQGLDIDSLKEELRSRTDATRNITNNFPQIEPVLLVDSTGIKLLQEKDGIKQFEFSIKSYSAGSTNFNIKSDLIFEYIDGSKSYGGLIIILPGKFRLPKEATWATPFKIKEVKLLKSIFFYLRGTYTTLDGIKTYDIDDVYQYDILSQRTSVSLNNAREEVIKSVPK